MIVAPGLSLGLVTCGLDVADRQRPGPRPRHESPGLAARRRRAPSPAGRNVVASPKDDS